METRSRKRRRVNAEEVLMPFVLIGDLCRLILSYDVFHWVQPYYPKWPMTDSVVPLSRLELHRFREARQWTFLSYWYTYCVVDILNRLIHAAHTTQWTLPWLAPDHASYAQYSHQEWIHIGIFSRPSPGTKFDRLRQLVHDHITRKRSDIYCFYVLPDSKTPPPQESFHFIHQQHLQCHILTAYYPGRRPKLNVRIGFI